VWGTGEGADGGLMIPGGRGKRREREKTNHSLQERWLRVTMLRAPPQLERLDGLDAKQTASFLLYGIILIEYPQKKRQKKKRSLLFFLIKIHWV